MTDREKIISIIGNVPNVGILSFDVISKIANYLISHGVNVREKGEWIEIIYVKAENGGSYGVEMCPKCRYCTGMWAKEYNFCPNCGADMRKRGDIK